MRINTINLPHLILRPKREEQEVEFSQFYNFLESRQVKKSPLLPVKELKINLHDSTVLRGEDFFTFSSEGIAAILSLGGITSPGIMRNFEDQDETEDYFGLFNDLVNTKLAASKKKVHLMYMEDNESKTMTGVCSKFYSHVENAKLVEDVRQQLDSDEYSFNNGIYYPNGNIRFSFVKNLNRMVVDQPCKVGINFSNGDQSTGCAMKVGIYWEVLVCSNGMTSSVGENSFSISHRNLEMSNVMDRLRLLTENEVAMSNSFEEVGLLKSTPRTFSTIKPRLIETVGREKTKEFEENFEIDFSRRENNYWSLINQVTALEWEINKLSSSYVRKSSILHTIGGDMLENPSHYYAE